MINNPSRLLVKSAKLMAGKSDTLSCWALEIIFSRLSSPMLSLIRTRTSSISDLPLTEITAPKIGFIP